MKEQRSFTDKAQGPLAHLPEEAGQALAEYGIILALVFAACVIAVGLMGLVIAGELGDVAAAFP